MKAILFGMSLGVAAALGGCGEADDVPAVAEVTITPDGDEMRYAVTEFTVRPGQRVHLVLKNTARDSTAQHNVVILRSQGVVERVGTAALAAGQEVGYLPEDEAILAYTPLCGPGETVEVSFTAPQLPGDYPYICTYPGHWTLMQGTMHVVER